jgi:hypothetical protein
MDRYYRSASYMKTQVKNREMEVAQKVCILTTQKALLK